MLAPFGTWTTVVVYRIDILRQNWPCVSGVLVLDRSLLSRSKMHDDLMLGDQPLADDDPLGDQPQLMMTWNGMRVIESEHAAEAFAVPLITPD